MAASTNALEDALQRLKDHADWAAKDAASAAAAVIDRGIKLELSRSSHPKGTKTPASPGEPPSLITGRLRQSVRMTRLRQTGAGQWTANVAPTTVYARIQELGGHAGKGHRSHLPPRPYVKPAFQMWQLKAYDAAISAFRKASGL
jgi:phage gpG-like protein